MAVIFLTRITHSYEQWSQFFLEDLGFRLLNITKIMKADNAKIAEKNEVMDFLKQEQVCMIYRVQLQEAEWYSV
jgi:hypothetical protein